MNVKSVAIPNVLFENTEIEGIEKLLYCNLMLDADEDLKVNISRKEMCNYIGRSEKSVNKYIKSLINNGFIEMKINENNKYEYKLLRFVEHMKRSGIDE